MPITKEIRAKELIVIAGPPPLDPVVPPPDPLPTAHAYAMAHKLFDDAGDISAPTSVRIDGLTREECHEIVDAMFGFDASKPDNKADARAADTLVDAKIKEREAANG